MIDISILRALKTRENFDKVFQHIPIKSLEKRTQIIVKDIQKYYTRFTEANSIDYVTFKDMFFGHWHRGLDKDAQEFYNKILDHADKEHDEVSQSVIMSALLELALADNVMQLVERYNKGDEMDIIDEVEALVDSTKQARDRKVAVDMSFDIEELFKNDKTEAGLHYNNPALEAALNPATFGDDFLLVAARPNQGKTTFILGEATHMASQVDDRPVFWFNNEGSKQRIQRRGIQVALGATLSEMHKLQEQNKLLGAYEEAIKAPHDRIRVIDIHSWWNWQVEALIEQHRPKLVVFDMIDKIKFAGLSLDGGARRDEILEAMYDWARELGVKYQLMPIATSQISVEGEGMPYPDKSMLKDSKTGKQGSADTICMLGHSNDPMLVNSRYVSTPKTKSKKEGASLPRQEFSFDIDRGLFIPPEN